MAKLYRDEEGNVVRLVSINGFVPEGLTEVPAEEVEAEELTLERARKMEEIRAKRDAMLLVNDKDWLIASKKGEDTTALEADAQALRDMTTQAQTDVDALATVDDIKAHDAFAGLSLSKAYE